MRMNLVTGKMEEGEGDPALAGAHHRNIDRDIDTALRRIAKEDRVKRKAERLKLKADQVTAKAILAESGEDMVAIMQDIINRTEPKTTKAQILKRLKSEAWYNPPVVIELHARLVKDGKL
jgi:hypothetical protein